MSSLQQDKPPGNTEARWLVLIYLAAGVSLLVVFVYPGLAWAGIPTAYGLLLGLVLSTLVALRLFAKGTASVPCALALLGILYIVVGGVVDMIATVVHSPDLEREENLVGRGLDSGHGLAFTYAYAIVAQSLYLATISILWLALLRHRDVLCATVAGQSSVLAFIKAATGGANLTWRQWMCPLKMSELPTAYHLLWLGAVMLMSGTLYRWYLGLEWFELVPRMRVVVVGIALTMGLLAYFVWLRYASSRLPIPPIV